VDRGTVIAGNAVLPLRQASSGLGACCNLVVGLSQAGREDLARRKAGAAWSAAEFLPLSQHHPNAWNDYSLAIWRGSWAVSYRNGFYGDRSLKSQLASASKLVMGY
jgi:hypothetical protein